jgi:tetratricopeptide (TPR) repeat protein
MRLKVGAYRMRRGMGPPALYYNPSLHTDTLNNLGVLYDEMGEKDAALEHYQRALSILKLRLGEEHLDVANTLNNLSILYSHIGEKAKALEFCQKSLDIKVKARGPIRSKRLAPAAHVLGACRRCSPCSA